MPRELSLSEVDPGEFWRASRVGDPAAVTAVRELGPGRAGGVRLVDLEGPSLGPGRHPGCRRLMARAHLHERSPEAPVVIILHGFAVPAPLYDERFARMFAGAGVSAVRLDLPYHLRRRIRGRCSGAGFFGADPALVRESIRQSVEDASALVAWARARGSARVCLLGFSLGGLVALLLAAQVEVDEVLAVVPFCDPATTFLEQLPRRVRERIGLVDGAGGIWGADTAAARAALDASLAPVIARNLTPRTPGGRMTLVAAELDTIVGPRPIGDLAARWGARCWTYDGHGHMSVLVARGFWSRTLRQLAPAAELPVAVPSAAPAPPEPDVSLAG